MNAPFHERLAISMTRQSVFLACLRPTKKEGIMDR